MQMMQKVVGSWLVPDVDIFIKSVLATLSNIECWNMDRHTTYKLAWPWLSILKKNSSIVPEFSEFLWTKDSQPSLWRVNPPRSRFRMKADSLFISFCGAKHSKAKCVLLNSPKIPSAFTWHMKSINHLVKRNSIGNRSLWNYLSFSISSEIFRHRLEPIFCTRENTWK